MKTLGRLPLQSEIIEFIKQYIDDENLKCGDKLPSQMELIEMMGVSRSSIREAIKTLEAKNIVEVVNGKGIYVKDGSPNIISAEIEFKKEKESILELLEVRRILEKEILLLVIQNATDEEIDEIGKILGIVLEKYEHGEKQNVEDHEFHIAIHKACHNRTMIGLIQSVTKLLDKIWDFPFGMNDPFINTMPLHKELYESIKNRNVKKAQAVNEKIIKMMCGELKDLDL